MIVAESAAGAPGDAARSDEGLTPRPFELPLRLGPLKLATPSILLSQIELDGLLFAGVREVRDADLPARSVAFAAVPDEAAAMPTIRLHDGHIDYVHHRYTRCWIDMRGAFDAYQTACLSAKLRSDIRRQTKRFLEHTGETALDVRFYRTAQEIEAFSVLAEQISARTFQEKTAGCGWPRGEDFKRGLMRSAERDGCFGSILCANQMPVSYQFMTRKNKRLIGTYIGFDPAYQKYSPGKIHMLACIRHLFDDPSSEIYDFAGGGFRYMIDFSSDRAACADMLRLSPRPWHLLVIGAHLTLATLARKVTALCDGLRLKECLRRKLRGR
ncbi:MAG: GNAT family N-acetyltransferase [Alphaproteobacteria bacterium]